MCIYTYIYYIHIIDIHGAFFSGKIKSMFVQEKIIISSVHYRLNYIHVVSIKQNSRGTFERIAGINLPLVLWFLRGQDQRPDPIKSIKIKTEVVGGWGGTPREITSSFVVQSTVAKKFTLVRSFLIHYL